MHACCNKKFIVFVVLIVKLASLDSLGRGETTKKVIVRYDTPAAPI